MANSQGAANGGIVGPDNNVEIGRFTRFTAPGTYTTGGCTSVDLLVVGGGAGGSAGGGGAGGVRLISSHPIPSSPIPVTVGSGGNGVPSWPCCTSSDGTASNFAAPSPIAATGGGGSSGNNINADGRPGGSGGGGGGSFIIVRVEVVMQVVIVHQKATQADNLEETHRHGLEEAAAVEHAALALILVLDQVCQEVMVKMLHQFWNFSTTILSSLSK